MYIRAPIGHVRRAEYHRLHFTIVKDQYNLPSITRPEPRLVLQPTPCLSKMFSTSEISLLITALAGFSKANPVPQYPGAPPTIGSCEEHWDYKNIKAGPSYQGPWQMVSNEVATSNSEDPGTLTATYSDSVGVTITEGFSLGLNL